MSVIATQPNQSIQLLTKMPSIATLYRRSITPKKHIAKNASEIPSQSIEIHRISLNRKKVEAYAEVCGFNYNKQNIPLTYPHILAFTLQLELMTRKAFPIPILGLVHLRNTITRLKPISIDAELSIAVVLSEARQTDKGIEVDFRSEASNKGELVWHSVSTYLYRQKQTASQPQVKKKHSPFKKFRYSEFWNLKENTGRRYAKVSGDANPIHIHKWAAQFFGFKQAVVHGMWTKARTIGAILPLIKSDKVTVSVEFKQPVFLPSKTILHYQEVASGINLEVRNEANDKLHMKGSIQEF